jgi:hypothetical protein
VTDELTPEQEADVRRLLAQARHDGPVPDDVATRLDEVLEGLVAHDEAADEADDLEVFGSETSAPVTDLAAARHRRRNAGRLLLVAAAVIVGGVAVGQNLGGAGLDGSGDDAGSANSSLSDAPRDGADLDEEAAGESGQVPHAASEPATSDEIDLLQSVRAPLTLTSENFARDVQRQLERTAAARRQAANADYDGVLAYASKNRDFVCADGAYGEGATLPAYYDAEEAVLVLRRPRSGLQRVDLVTCGTAVELNSIELPAP